MSKELTTTESNDLIFDPKNLTKETIKKYLCKEATDQELMYGLQVAKSLNLNPLKREIYFVKHNANSPMTTITGYEVYIKRAERSGKYAGMKSWTEGSVKDGNLTGFVEVYVKGWDKPLVHSVDYSEYVQRKADGSITKFWANKPKTMIKKVAIAQGFRLAFPDELDGIPYTDAEIDEETIIEQKHDNGKSRIENIIEEAEIVLAPVETPAPKQEPTPTPKPKPDPVKEIEQATQHKIKPIELKEGELSCLGFITGDKSAQVEGPDGKPATKWNFTIGESNYGTFDKKIADEMKAIIKRQIEDKTQVFINVVFKDRIKNDKVFHDIVRFQIATLGDKVLPI